MAHKSSCDCASSQATSCSVARRRNGSQQLVAPLRVDLSACKYELLRLVAARLGWQVVPAGSADSAWDLYWTDTSISQERLLRLAPTQRINHFYGMLELCRKRSMAKALTALAAAAEPAAACYDFFPPTWQLPNQLGEFLAAAKAAGKKATFIVKPDAGCQGKGIRLVQGGSEKSVLKSLAGMTTLQAVAQAYLPQPYLVHGLKFDLRVYVLVADVDPLRLYIFKEGLVRFCTAPYKKPTSKNLACAYMHLTNYAINKHNTEAFVTPGSEGSSSSSRAEALDAASHMGAGSSDDDCRADTSDEQSQQHAADASSKWSFRQLRQHLESQGHSWSTLWSAVGQLVVKSLLAVAPHLAATYRATVVNSSCAGGGSAAACSSPMTSSATGSGSAAVSSAAVAAAGCRCFEILGFDVLLDANLKPWLIEVNHSPSFNMDSPLDKSTKGQLIMDAVRLVRIEPVSIAAAKKAARRATQARLVAPPPPRGSSLADIGMCGASGACSADARAAQQAHREAVIAARDNWQLKHLGGFERLYPVHMPALQQQSPSSSSTAYSPAKLQELVELQEAYDKLLTISQQVHQQQHQHQQQSQSPAKMATFGVGSDGRGWPGSSQKCLSMKQQQAASNNFFDSDSSKCDALAPQNQQCGEPTARISTDDSEEDDSNDCKTHTCSISIPSADMAQQVTVESALALLSAALAAPDGGLRNGLMQRRPASADSRRRSSSCTGADQCRPQPAVGSSRKSCSRPQSAAGVYARCTTTSDTQHGKGVAASASMAGQGDVSSKATTTTTSSSSACTSTSKQLQKANCAGPHSHAGSATPAVRPRPASVPRLRPGSADTRSAAASSTPGGSNLLDKIRPLSSGSGRSCTLGGSSVHSLLMHDDTGSQHAAAHKARSATSGCTSVTCAAHAEAGNNKNSSRSSSTGRVRSAYPTSGSAAAASASVICPVAPAESACCGSSSNHHQCSSSSMLQPLGKGVIAAAIAEATAALDQAVAVAAGEAVGRGASTPRGQCTEHIGPGKINSAVVDMNTTSKQINSTLCHVSNRCLVSSLHGQSSSSKSVPGSVLYSSSKVETAADLQCHPTIGRSGSNKIGTDNVLISGNKNILQTLRLGAAYSHASQSSMVAGGTSCLARFNSFPSRTSASAGFMHAGNTTTPAGRGVYQLQLGVAQIGELASSSRDRTNNTTAAAKAAPAYKQAGSDGPAVQLYRQQLRIQPGGFTQQHDACALLQQLQSDQHLSTGNATLHAADAGLVGTGMGWGERRLLRHCSTGGLLGRLRLKDAS